MKIKGFIIGCILCTSLTGVTVQAAPRDVKNLDTNKVYMHSEYSIDPNKFNEMLIDMAGAHKFSYEMDNRVYDFDKVDKALGDGKKLNKTVRQVLDELKNDDSFLISPDSPGDTVEFDIEKIY
ncbi:hypothetical protein P8V03_15595 [Clostridium sp. A1-XYC3]|uniref:Uncharacterized protein n=1 Tax=Clostridium tanneri TaxID=3037988 RepID=A0ABU4JWM4_9CLOT|nr:hypothetical protein [Clostridium sp. A1-XYC3]MDW8802571.1 hypothetical protein [Clostridium sp. A1-XYC3]